jgi:hypothetical protein
MKNGSQLCISRYTTENASVLTVTPGVAVCIESTGDPSRNGLNNVPVLLFIKDWYTEK